MKIFKYVILFTAFCIEFSAAFFSVYGLTKLFSGSFAPVLFMASSLEVGKIAGAMYLYKNWNEVKFAIKFYLTIALLIMLSITSLGIYGFLTNAFQEPLHRIEKYEISQRYMNERIVEIDRLIAENKKQIEYINEQKEKINQQYDLDKKDRRMIFEKMLSASSDNEWRNYSAAKNYQKSLQEASEIFSNEMNQLNKRQKEFFEKNIALMSEKDSLNKKISEEKLLLSKEGIDIGPIKFISESLQIPINNLVNYLILLIIFVFDPFALILLISYSDLDRLEKKKKLEEERKELEVYCGVEKVNGVDALPLPLSTELNRIKEMVVGANKEIYNKLEHAISDFRAIEKKIFLDNQKIIDVVNGNESQKLAKLNDFQTDILRKIENVNEKVYFLNENVNLIIDFIEKCDLHMKNEIESIDGISQKIDQLRENALENSRIEFNKNISSFSEKIDFISRKVHDLQTFVFDVEKKIQDYDASIKNVLKNNSINSELKKYIEEILVNMQNMHNFLKEAEKTNVHYLNIKFSDLKNYFQYLLKPNDLKKALIDLEEKILTIETVLSNKQDSDKVSKGNGHSVGENDVFHEVESKIRPR